MEVTRSASRAQIRAQRFALLCLLLCCVPSSARAAGEDDARTAFGRGVAASQEGRWEDARAAFELSRQAVEKPSTLFNLAVACVKLGRGEEALEVLAAFERLAVPAQHGAMLASLPGLRAQAASLVRPAPARPSDENRLAVPLADLPPEVRDDAAFGRAAYAEGRDMEALSAFERAYQRSRRAELLLNIGLAADRLRQDERAVRAFEGFIAAFPSTDGAAYARTRVELLQRLISERARMHVAPVTGLDNATSPGERTPEPRSPAPTLAAPRSLVGLGVSLALASVGTGLWWRYQAEQRAGCSQSDGAECYNRSEIERFRRSAMGLTLALDVTAVGLTTAGGIWLSRSKRTAGRAEGRSSVREQNEAAGLSVRFTGLGMNARFSF